MVGRFGEVYLVDWGVAVALSDDGSGRFPLATEIQNFAGTPSYMAPEMLGGRTPKLDVRTDVYLLGATLFHVIAGHAPHRGTNIMEIAAAVSLNDPEPPPRAPARLAEVCKKAMARAPAERYPSADAFRAAIADFLRHRDAVALAEEGESKLAELRELARKIEGDEEAHRLRMFNTYSESRLGFRLARRLWPDSGQVLDGLQHATETMVVYLLDRGDVASATTLVGQLVRPLEGDLAARFEAAKQAGSTQRRRLAQLEKLEHEQDPSVGRRARFVAYAVVAGFFVFAGLLGQFHPPAGGHSESVITSVALASLLAVIGVAGRRSLLATRLNRQIYFAVSLAFVGKLCVHAAVAILGAPAWHGYALSGLVYAVVAAMLAITYQPRVFPTAIAFAAAALASAAYPDVRYAVYAAASFVMLVNTAWLARIEGKRDPS
jgi:eukaryotic-like serine/threonine-protein kinase